MIMCTAMHGECLAPHQMPTTYTNYYDCLQAGYKEAINKQTQIGRLALESYFHGFLMDLRAGKGQYFIAFFNLLLLELV